MAERSLPNRPNLEHLKGQARSLQRDLQSIDGTKVTLASAQRDLALQYGFASWTKLVRHVETVSVHTRLPHTVGLDASGPDRMVRLACLTYGGDDDIVRHREATSLLAANPAFSKASVSAAAATGDVDSLRHFLDDAAEPGQRRQR